MAADSRAPSGTPPPRRGRREEALDDAQPAHRVAFAGRLRDLRAECGQPPYRTLSRLAHCSAGSLSAAAGGRRFPTWETTRGYVTGCLAHAGRADEIDRVLPGWRLAWDDAALQEKALRTDAPPEQAPVQESLPGQRQEPDPSPRPGLEAEPRPELERAPGPARGPRRPVAEPEPVPPPAGRPRPLVRAAAVVVALLTLMATMVAAGSPPKAPEHMTGLYNILVAPFTSLPALERTLVRDLDAWAGADPAIETRGPAGVARVAADDEQRRDTALDRLAAAHGADVVLTGRLRKAGERWTVTIDVVLTERVFGETPEFVGRHEIGLTEPADVIGGNVELNRQLAGDAIRYVRAVVAFVRGLGRYAIDDYPGAEQSFRTADAELSALTAPVRAEVVLLMLGNAVGRAARYTEAAEIFRRALTAEPGYARASVGLAEALRASAGCTPEGVPALRQALGQYRDVAEHPGTPLLAMKTRLGLGLTYQCLGIGGAPDWRAADAEFDAVLRMQAESGLDGEAGRQALRLAAEARAGQALTAWLTGRAPAAAAGYEDALRMLDRIGVERPTVRDRRLVFLRNLRDVYVAMRATPEADAVEARIRRAGGTP